MKASIEESQMGTCRTSRSLSLGTLAVAMALAFGACSSAATASVAPASVAPASVAPASVAPASVAPASVAPASVAAASVAAAAAASAHAGKQPPYRIALSNSFLGNTWRVEMVNLLTAAAAMPPYNTLVKLTVDNVGNTPTDQIQSIENMITSGDVDAIIMDASSPTALNPAIEQATAAGIPVVAFDNDVTAPSAYNVNVVQTDYSVGMDWLCKVLHGQGNIIMELGIAGTDVDNGRAGGARSAMAKCPGLKDVEDVRGNWDDATTESVMIQALTTHPEANGVWSEGISQGILNAIVKTHHKWIPVAGGADNGSLKMTLQYASAGAQYVGVGNSPGMSAVAMKVAVGLLQGQTEPKFTVIPLNYLESQNLKAGVNVFPNLPDGLQDNWQVPGFNFTVQQALSGAGGTIK